MYISILFNNDGAPVAYVDPAVAERERNLRTSESDDPRNNFHVKSVLLVGTFPKGRT
jgi:hypothetical protein